MKKSILFYMLILLPILNSCSKEDEEFYNAVYTSIPNLVTLEVESNYNVNDVLWLNTNNFSRYLNQPSQTTPLDVFKTTKSNYFVFTYRLEKKINEVDWENVSVGNNFVVEKGRITTNLYITGYADFNSTTNQYEHRGGIKLTQPGQYRLVFFDGYNGSNFDLISDSANNFTFLTINTSAVNLSGTTYNFTVN
ncbi:hypothetical protein [Flavobacterium filum]|uniref:hypothetical protein n=1 Tax=Flavobacterium filum TaxID=370974 RepID=UPI0023F067A0|nr:hypothetical protein [Flavobacterium filum]